ncbi:PTS sugar transporter subunit IIB [Lacticaseibacillus parakribbianus]|uniref:PTS sugar transporter subunit IIB n=1 Tax=Lacticaseibacillus parakribbianus TaxID=2970927 RepID=UPI0021CAE542|nr:PTS sugar transporter subunit IIB [Lacticaseibacillus parakribbianus]
MAKQTILVACGNGMSSSMLAQRMQTEANAQGLDVSVSAVAIKVVPSEVEKHHPGVVMIGPQVRYAVPDLQKKVAIPVVMIDQRAYGMMDGKKVLADGLALIAEHEQQ